MKAPRTAGLNLDSILDTTEKIAGYVPGAVRGIRGIFGKGTGAAAAAGASESEFATPASFAIVQNNITQQTREEPVSHSTLGIAGVRFRGSQPFATVSPKSTAPPLFFRAGGPAQSIDGFHIAINPIVFGGPLAVKAQLYQRFVFRKLRVLFTTSQATTFLGACALAVEPDIANMVATDFQTVREVVPSVTFPYRIPQACLNWAYDGPELYWTAPESYVAVAADQRQAYQGVVTGFDATLLPDGVVTGFLDVEYEIDFFDPTPPNNFAPTTMAERQAVHALLTGLRRPKSIVPRVFYQSTEDKEWLKAISALAAREPDDFEEGKEDVDTPASVHFASDPSNSGDASGVAAASSLCPPGSPLDRALDLLTRMRVSG